MVWTKQTLLNSAQKFRTSQKLLSGKGRKSVSKIATIQACCQKLSSRLLSPSPSRLPSDASVVPILASSEPEYKIWIKP